MAVNLSPVGGVAAQFFDNDGNVLSGGKIYTYAAGTNTPQSTYTTGSGLIAHANPIILDSAGRVPTGEIWLTDGSVYKFVIKDANDTLIGTYDNIVGINSNFVNYSSSQEIQTATAGQTVFTLTTMAYQPATNTLSVFVDGVNQYGPGAQYAYTETSSTSVTFTNGLHVGASVKFTTSVINNAGGVDASQVTYNPPFTGGEVTNVEAKLAQIVSVKDFGAVGDGVTDDTAAIQAAIDSGAGAVYFPTSIASYYITAQLVLNSNQQIYGDGPSSWIEVIDGSANAFYANGKSGINIRNLKISCKTQANPTDYKGAVVLQSCSNCTVENLSVFNMHYWGVALASTNDTTVQNCRFSSFWGVTTSVGNDSACISLYKQSSENYINNNYITAATWHGILVQDPYTGDTPAQNIISDNYIAGGQLAYGIALYATTSYDMKHIIKNNRISGVLGTALSGASGSGIYLQSGTGSVVDGNEVFDCCKSTTNFATLNPACIAVHGAQTGGGPSGVGGRPNVVSNNVVNNTYGPGISTATANLGPIITNNIITCKSTASHAVKVVDASMTKVLNNTIVTDNSDAAIICAATANVEVGSVTSYVQVRGNSVQTSTAIGVYLYPTTGTFANFNISDNQVWGGNTSAVLLDTATNVQMSGNDLSSTGSVLAASNTVNLRMSHNRLYSNSGNTSIQFASGTSGVCDESNSLVGVISNTTTGPMIVSQYANQAPPFSGSFGKGDRVIQSVPVVGQPTGWRCTVAGNPGTWVSEGNL